MCTTQAINVINTYMTDRGGKRPGAGRPKGAINKRSKELTERLDELGVDPIEGMAMISADPTTSPELKFQCFKELAQYIAPKRKAVEQHNTGDVTIEVVNYADLDEDKDSV